jgi:hypothetical protein
MQRWLRLAWFVILTACVQPTPTLPFQPTRSPTFEITIAPRVVELRIEPFIPADWGDRVTGPATAFVLANGAIRAEVYVQPVEGPFSNTALADARLVGVDIDPTDGFAVSWLADEPFFAVKLYALAFWPDQSEPVESDPVWILLDWRQATATAQP